MSISNIFGYGGTVVAVIGFQLKKQSQIIVCQFISNLLVALSYVMLGPSKMAGGAVCFIGAIQTFVNYLYFKKNETPPRFVTVLSFVAYIAAAVITIFMSGNMLIPYAWLPLVGSIIFMIAVSTENSTLTRILFFFNMCVWITYDVISQPIAIANLLTHVCIMISVIVGILRYDIKAKVK